MRNNETINRMLEEIPLKYSNEEIPNSRFEFPRKQKKYRIVFPEFRGYKCKNQGIIITIQYNKIKFPIGARRLYDTYEDALKVANLWKALIKNSRTTWKFPFEIVRIVDEQTKEKIISL